MADYNDIRNRFSIAYDKHFNSKPGINEASEPKRQFFYNLYNAYIDKTGYDGRTKIHRNPIESLRADLGTSPDEFVGNMLVDAGVDRDVFELSILPPMEEPNESSKFNAVLVKFKEDTQIKGEDVKQDEEYLMVNSVSTSGGSKAVVGKKDTTPERMGVAQYSYDSADALIAQVKKYIAQRDWPENYKNFIIEMMQQTINQADHEKVPRVEQVFPQKEYNITFNENLVQKYEIDSESLANISNDFGEVLGGIFLFSMVMDPGAGISYPQESNAAMIDFYFDNWSISSKAGLRGGLPSIKGAVSTIIERYKNGSLELEQDELDFYNNVVKTFKRGFESRSEVFDTTLLFAQEYLANIDSGFNHFLNETQLSTNSLDKDQIFDTIINLYETGNFWPIFSTYFELTGVQPKGFENESDAKESLEKFIQKNDKNKILGPFFYPLQVEVANWLNRNYQPELTSLVNQASNIQQLYLITSPKKAGVTFKFKNFESSNFQFKPGSSSRQPFNKNITLMSK